MRRRGGDEGGEPFCCVAGALELELEELAKKLGYDLSLSCLDRFLSHAGMGLAPRLPPPPSVMPEGDDARVRL